MSRYSSNFCVRFRSGSSALNRTPDSISPSTFMPPSVSWAPAAPALPRTSTAARIRRMGVVALMARPLSREGVAGRAVRAVDVRVAAYARASQHELERGRLPRSVRARRGAALDVALLAEPPGRHPQRAAPARAGGGV